MVVTVISDDSYYQVGVDGRVGVKVELRVEGGSSWSWTMMG